MTGQTEQTIGNHGDRLDDIERQISMLETEKKGLICTQSAVESASNESLTSAINERQLQLLNEHFRLKRKGHDMKDKMTVEKNRLRQQFESYQQTAASEPDDEHELDEQIARERQRLQEITGDLALLSKKVSIQQRQFDEFPLQAELVQYRKRFVELYNQGT
jgi:hypothetical protein